MLRPSLKFLRRNVVPTSLVDGFFNKRSEACFSKVPITFIFLAWKADQTLNNFENNTMKLLENEAILTGLWASNCATIQQVLILKFAFRLEKFPGLSRNGPLVYEFIFTAHGLNYCYLQQQQQQSFYQHYSGTKEKKKHDNARNYRKRNDGNYITICTIFESVC